MIVRQREALLSALACLILVGLGSLANHAVFAPHPLSLGAGQWLEHHKPIPDFALISDSGPFLKNDLLGHWTLVFAGFTACPTVCPTTLATLKQAKTLLEPAQAERLEVLFISIDPGRDDPKRLADYAHHFDLSFRGLTGPDAQLQALLERGLGLVFLRQAATAGQEVSIDHSSHVAIIDPTGRLAGYFSPPFTPAALASDLKAILGESLP